MPVPIRHVLTIICFLQLLLAWPAWGAPMTGKVLLENGMREFQQKHFTESIEWFSHLLELEPFNARIYKYRAAAYMELEQYDEAIHDLTSAVNLDPDLSGAHNNLGAAWYEKQNYTKAIVNYSIEIRQRPDSFSAYFNRAMAREKLGNHDQALDDIESVLLLKPDNDMALCFQADILEAMNQTDKARESLEKALAVNPANAYARDQLARLNAPPESLAVPEPPPVTAPDPATGDDSATAAPTAASAPDQATVTARQRRWDLQAGAFNGEKNALAMARQLEQLGFDMKIVAMTDRRGKTWYLVRQGPLDKQEAREACDRLKKHAGVEGLVRRHDKF